MSEAPENTRCVLLNPTGRGRTGDLTSDLRGRGWETVAFTDPFLAMAALCLEDRTQSARTAWGLRPSRTLALVLAGESGADERRTGMLIDAVQRYLPSVAILRAVEGDLIPVPPPEPAEPREAAPIPEPAATRETGAADPLERDHGAADGPAAEPDPEGLEGEVEAPAPVEITREEIDMLFAYGEERGEP